MTARHAFAGMHHGRALLAAVWVMTLAACGGSDDAPPPPPPPAQGSATVGAAGGFVDGPDGVRLGLPPEATASAVTFRIARDSSGAPAVPEGVDLVSAIYAITPHGQEFNLPVSVRVPSSPSLAAGRATFLMKASPGGRWAVIGTDTAAVTSLQASIGSLSYFAVGVCSNNLPPGSIGAQNCPTSNVLRFDLFTDGGTPFPVSQDTTFGAIRPVVLITTPTTLTGRVTWTRAPLSLGRIDRLDTGSRFAGSLTRQAGIAWSSEAPDGLEVTQNVDRTFTITVTPSQVAGAGGLNGVVRPLWVQAQAGPWEYLLQIPIQVRDISASPPNAPVISTPPANLGVVEGQPAAFSVVATISPAATLSYRWLRRSDAAASFAPIAGATQAGYTLTPTTLADNGAQFQVEVCVQGTTRCVTSAPATLTVTRATRVPSFAMQPASLAVSAGQTASFTAVATGVPAPSIRWQTAAAGSTAFTDLTTTACPQTPAAASGDSTTATCTVGPVAIGDTGRRYRALAINAVAAPGVPSNEATLTVTPAPAAPSITTQPAPQSTTVGGSATFSVAATGTAPLAYTWRLNGTALPGAGSFTIGACSGTVSASGASLTLTGLGAGCNSATVTVVIANGINPDATSDGVARLTVVPAGGPGLALLAGAIGGQGLLDGAGSEARVQIGAFNGIAVDGAGTAYFSDSIGGRLRKVTAAGVATTLPNELRSPSGVAVDSAGNAYVAESANHRILRFAPDGSVSVWAGSGVQGSVDGIGTQARLSNPTALTIDVNGNLFVLQDVFSAPRIRRISPTQEVTTVFVFAGTDGVSAIVAGSDGNLYGLGIRSMLQTVQRITPSGVTSVVAGSAEQRGNVDGTGAAARFQDPGGLTFGADGHLYVTDSNNFTVRRVTLAGAVTTVSGAPAFPLVPGDGTGTAGRYEFPSAIGRAPNGDLLIGDASTLRRLSPSFVLTTLIGQRLATGTVDGSGTSARFRVPLGGVALDASGNAYVADLDRIRVVTPAGAVSTLVTQQPAKLIVRDAGSGFVIASDTAVWRMTATGVATLLAGDPQFADYVDAAVGTDARFGFIRGLAVDAGGNVFVAETINQNATLRRITPGGAVTTWAGAKDAPPEILDGTGGAARFGFLVGGLAFDANGDLMVADFSTSTGAALLRRITPQGTVSTVNGAVLQPALTLALAADGSLLAGGDATLQRITPSGSVTTLVGTPPQRGVKLGSAPNFSFVSGLAVRPNGRIVLTSEAAVLELTLP